MLPLSSLEIFQWGVQNIGHIFGGVSFTAPYHLRTEPTLYICNDNGHWVALYIGLERNEYFDSLGGAPSRAFEDILGANYINCPVSLQSPLLPSCGYYCLYYGFCRARGISFDDVITTLRLYTDEVITQTVQHIHPVTSGTP